MADLAFMNGFDADQEEPMRDFKPLPEGKYLAKITESEMKATKAGTGRYLQLTLEVLEEGFSGRLLWVRLNLDNPNPKAVEIARAEFASVCRAVGVPRPNDSQELHGIPLIVKVKQKTREDNGEITNEIKGFYSRSESATVGASAAKSAPPWARQENEGDDLPL